MKTFMPKAEEVERKYYLIDAKDKVLGKVATKAADLIRGRHKPIFTPHVDTGDYVIVINAEKVKVTGKKLDQKEYKRFSGYPAGQRVVKLGDMLKKSPETVIEHAVKLMVPKSNLGDKIHLKLKVYAGENHPHKAQKPISVEI